MKIPDKISKEWLNQTPEGSSYPNAHAIFDDGGMMDKITDDLMPGFLAVEDEGVTVLHRVCGEKPDALLRLKKFLTPDLLTKEIIIGNFRGTPLEWALINGHENKVPWDALHRQKWLSKLEQLSDLQEKLSRRKDSKYPRLAKFITRVEKVKKLKSVPHVQH